MRLQTVNIGASAFNMPAGPFKAYITEPSKITSTQNANQVFAVDAIVSAPGAHAALLGATVGMSSSAWPLVCC